jgi:hypothetical protein
LAYGSVRDTARHSALFTLTITPGAPDTSLGLLASAFADQIEAAETGPLEVSTFAAVPELLVLAHAIGFVSSSPFTQ